MENVRREKWALLKEDVSSCLGNEIIMWKVNEQDPSNLNIYILKYFISVLIIYYVRKESLTHLKMYDYKFFFLINFQK